MKKHEQVRAHILYALSNGFTVTDACQTGETAFHVRIQPQAIKGGCRFVIYYLRLGNAVEKAASFCCTSQGLPMPEPTDRKSKTIMRFFDMIFQNFIEECTNEHG